VVVGHVHLLHDLAARVGLHQLGGEAPEDHIVVIGADPLEVMRVDYLAGDGSEFSSVRRRSGEQHHGRQHGLHSLHGLSILLSVVASEANHRCVRLLSPNADYSHEILPVFRPDKCSDDRRLVPW
jgi:hypothetical protein